MNAPTPFAHTTPPPSWVIPIWTATPLMPYFLKRAALQCERKAFVTAATLALTIEFRNEDMLPLAA